MRDMTEDARSFRHQRTPEGQAAYQQLWPKAKGADAWFGGRAVRCGDIGGTVVVVRLFDGEQVVVLVGNGDQSGAETAARLDLEVDNAEVKVTSCGRDGAYVRLARSLPKAAFEAVAPWLGE